MCGHSISQGNTGKSHSIHTEVHFPSPPSPIAPQVFFLLYIPTPSCTAQPWVGQELSWEMPKLYFEHKGWWRGENFCFGRKEPLPAGTQEVTDACEPALLFSCQGAPCPFDLVKL